MTDTMFFKLSAQVDAPGPLGISTTAYEDAFATYSNLLSWHKPAAAKVTLDGSTRVSSYSPTVGTGTFDQTTAGKRPLYVDDYLAGSPVLYLDSSRHDAMQWAGTFPSGTGSKHTVAALVRPSSSMVGLTGNILGGQGAGSVGRHIMRFRTDNYAHQIISNGAMGAVSTTAFIPDQWNLVVASYSDTADIAYINVNHGTPVSISGSDAISTSLLFMGAVTASDTTNTFLGHIADTWVFNEAAYVDSGMADIPSLLLSYCLDQYGLTLTA
jgi:hypothetical protein